MITSYAAMTLKQIFLVIILNTGEVLEGPAPSMAVCESAQQLAIEKYQADIDVIFCYEE